MGGNVAPQTTTFDSIHLEDERAVSRELTNGSDHSGAGADTEPTGDVDISGLETIVLQAFSKAAAQQEPEWFRMRGAVLKNRLLDLTNRTFDETDYGADRFLDVVELLHDMLKVDLEVKPFAVELLEPHRSKMLASVAVGTGQWIRPDLWKAIVDYISPGQWHWSPSLGAAIHAADDEHAGDGIPLPTLNPELLGQWRAEFADSLQEWLDEAERRQVETWSAHGLRSSGLPKRLVPGWNTLVRERVKERLIEFFDSHELKQPSNWVVSGQAQLSGSQLRRFVVQCINLMSEAELKDIVIPAHVAMRVNR